MRRGAISPVQARRIANRTKRAYGARITEFADHYDRFTSIADRLGYTAVVDIAIVALSTLDPLQALGDLITQLWEALKRGQPPESIGADRVLEWGKLRMEQDSALFAFLHTGIERQGSDASLCFWRDLPEAPIMCTFNNHRLRFPGLTGYVTAEREQSRWGSFLRRRSRKRNAPAARGVDQVLPVRSVEAIPDWFWFESLRQQLTQDNGLQCPYWNARECCGRRATLEGLLAHARPRIGFEGTWRRASAA